MSDETESQDTAAPPVQEDLALPVDYPVPLRVFERSLRPRRVPLVKNRRPVIVNGRQVTTMTTGHADEIWLKLLKIRHGTERHTPAEWSALIDKYREEPAHHTDPRMAR